MPKSEVAGTVDVSLRRNVKYENSSVELESNKNRSAQSIRDIAMSSRGCHKSQVYLARHGSLSGEIVIHTGVRHPTMP
jgi:hypothetical protein